MGCKYMYGGAWLNAFGKHRVKQFTENLQFANVHSPRVGGIVYRNSLNLDPLHLNH